jgi:hypothetical protein
MKPKMLLGMTITLAIGLTLLLLGRVAVTVFTAGIRASRRPLGPPV